MLDVQTAEETFSEINFPRIQAALDAIRDLLLVTEAADTEVTVLENRMSVAEDAIANAPDVSNLETRVSAAEGNITPLQTGLAAAQSAISSLQTAVSAIPAPVDVLSILANAASLTLGRVGGTLGFFGKVPVARQNALTAATGTAVGVTRISGTDLVNATGKTVIDNHTVRINQIEAALKAYGLLP